MVADRINVVRSSLNLRALPIPRRYMFNIGEIGKSLRSVTSNQPRRLKLLYFSRHTTEYRMVNRSCDTRTIASNLKAFGYTVYRDNKLGIHTVRITTSLRIIF